MNVAAVIIEPNANIEVEVPSRRHRKTAQCDFALQTPVFAVVARDRSEQPG